MYYLVNDNVFVLHVVYCMYFLFIVTQVRLSFEQ